MESTALSERELAVATRFADGLTYRQIAEVLYLSPATVRNHLAAVYRKLGVKSKAELIHRLAEDVEERAAHDTSALPDKPSVAVLPFANLSARAEDEFFADGLTDDIITGLSRIKDLFVVARNSTFTYKGRNVDVKTAAKELGVRYVVEGSVRHGQKRIRVSAHLEDGLRGDHIWTDNIDREHGGVLELQDEIARAIVASVQTQVILNEGRLSQEKPEIDRQLADKLSFARAKGYELTSNSLQEVRRLAEEVLESNPHNARAHFMLAFSSWHETYLGFSTDRDASYKTSIDAARKAVALDDADEYHHWMLGLPLSQVGRYEEAIAELERAIEINPNCSLAHGSLGTVHAWAGNVEEAIASTDLALRANPRDPSNFFRFFVLALSHFLAERFEESCAWSQKVVQRKPEWFMGHVFHIASLVELGRNQEAETIAERYCVDFQTNSLDYLRGLPIRDPELKSRFLRDLEEAGVQ